MENVLFVTFGALALASAILAITRKNAVAAAVWLVGMFFGLAGTFVLLEAYLVAVLQILVYAGAIMVLFLFVIMLLDLKSEDLIAGQRPRLKIPGIVLSALFLFLVGRAIVDAKGPRTGTIAPRASALLRLPPPAAPETDLLGGPAAPPAAPAPVDVWLSRREPAWIPLDDALREDLSRRPTSRGGPDASGEKPKAGPRPRAFVGSVPAGDTPRTVVVDLRHLKAHNLDDWVANSVYADVDADGVVEVGERLELAASQPESWSKGLWFDASFAAPGAVLEVVIEQGGLAAAPGGAPDGSPFAIGKSMFEDWVLPFEITSLLLLGAIFGAVVLTKRRLA